MPLERLWAGWRGEYVSSADSDDDGCVLCRVVEDGTHVVHRGERAAVILNAFPYTSGHVMAVPARHVGELEELDDLESTELWRLAIAAVTAIKAAYRPDGVNLGANLGRAAGAGVPGHCHLHVLPRWVGDTNFMTSVAEVRVMPEVLDRTLEKLQAAWPG